MHNGTQSDALLELTFDTLEPIWIPVKIKDQPARKLWLREAKEGDAVKYRNALAKAIRTDASGNQSIDGLPDTEPYLVSLCLFEEIENKKAKKTERVLVGRAFIDEMPPEVVQELFKAARKISGLTPRHDPNELRKAIAELQQLLAEQERGDPSKNLPAETPESSGTVTSSASP
jgi:hypothetical protein